MKKIGLLLTGILFVSLAFTSCSKDDDNGGGASIQGKWTFDKIGTIVDGEEILTDYPHESPECGLDYVSLNSGGNGTDGFFYLDTDDECVEENDSFSWTYEDNMLTITYSDDDETDPLEVIELTSSTLKVSESYDGTIHITVLKK